MVTFFVVWFTLAILALVINFALHTVNPRDDDP